MRQITLNFHGIGNPERALEPGEAPYWIPAGVFVDVLGLVDRLTDRSTVTITFDDGNASDMDIAASVLARHDRTATFFVLADRIGRPGSLSAKAIRELAAAGHRIGTHGAAHIDWRALDEAGEAQEWDAARATIADVLGAAVDEAAIPFGRYSGAVIRGLKARGYTCAWSSDGGSWTPGSFLRPRLSIRADMTIADVEAALLGCEPVWRKLRRHMAVAVKQRY